MKILKALIMGLMLIISTHAMAFDSAVSSGEKTSDALIVTGPGCLTAFEVITDGTNNAKLILYDNTTASGKVLNEMTVKGANDFGGREPKFCVEFYNGIYADITGTGASYIIETNQRN